MQLIINIEVKNTNAIFAQLIFFKQNEFSVGCYN